MLSVSKNPEPDPDPFSSSGHLRQRDHLSSTPLHLAYFPIVVLWLDLSHNVCSKGPKINSMGGKKTRLNFFDSGHAVTGKDMSFVLLNPRNLSIVVDHNENKPNFTN